MHMDCAYVCFPKQDEKPNDFLLHIFFALSCIHNELSFDIYQCFAVHINRLINSEHLFRHAVRRLLMSRRTL